MSAFTISSVNVEPDQRPRRRRVAFLDTPAGKEKKTGRVARYTKLVLHALRKLGVPGMNRLLAMGRVDSILRDQNLDGAQRMPGETAAQHCLRTPELLEMILLRTPPKEVLLAQRVSLLWNKVIEESVWLQRHLFLRPVDCAPVSWIDWRFDDKEMYSSTDLGHSLRVRPLVRRYVAHWGRLRSDRGEYRVFINPILAERFAILSIDSVKTGAVYTPGYGMEYANASWRKMLITQPPINTMFLWEDKDEEMRIVGRIKGWTVFPLIRSRLEPGVTGLDLAERLPGLASGPLWIDGSEFWREYRGWHNLHQVRRGGLT